MLLKYFHKCRSKKGFTAIELIIVVAVIGVMAGVAIPNGVSSYRTSQRSKQNEHARGFYMAVQNALLATVAKDNTESEFRLKFNAGGTESVRNRITSTSSAPSIVSLPVGESDAHFFIYLETDETGDIDKAWLSYIKPGQYVTKHPKDTFIASYDVATDTTRPSASESQISNRSFYDLIKEIQTFMDGDGEKGHYWVMFDVKFRVVTAHYSKDVNASRAKGVSYRTANRLLDGRPYGSYPRENNTLPQWFVTQPHL